MPHLTRHLRHERSACSVVVAGGVGASGPVGPFLEPASAAVVIDPEDPQVAVLLAERIPVADLGPDHRGVAVDGKDAGGEGEDLVRAVPVRIPHPPDSVQARDGFFVRSVQVDGIVGEDLSEAGRAGRPPGVLVYRDPAAALNAVRHLSPGAEPPSLVTAPLPFAPTAPTLTSRA